MLQCISRSWPLTDVPIALAHVCFSNRPFWVKRFQTIHHYSVDVASLIGHFGSSAFRLSTTTVSMSLAGSRFSSESAPRPFQHGIRRRGGTIFEAALPSD